MSEKFSLQWNEFHSNVSNSFSLLRNEDYLHDVTIVTDDNEQVAAHKLVLSACSEYFKNIFKKNKNTPLLLCLEGVNSSEIMNLLDFVYNGEIKIFQDDLESFLKVAKRFKLEGLLNEDVDHTINSSPIEKFKQSLVKEEDIPSPVIQEKTKTHNAELQEQELSPFSSDKDIIKEEVEEVPVSTTLPRILDW